MKCYKADCNVKAIIRFEYEVHKEPYCLEHLVERLEYIKENEFFHLISEIKKIIPIFNF